MVKGLFLDLWDISFTIVTSGTTTGLISTYTCVKLQEKSDPVKHFGDHDLSQVVIIVFQGLRTNKEDTKK